METNLRCATCGTLICPRCLVQTPVGMKCRECGMQKGGKLFTMSPLQVFCAIVVGLVFGVVAGWGVDFMGFFSIIFAVPYGTFAGEMIMRASGRKRGIRMEIISGATMILGAIGARMFVAALLMGAPSHLHPPFGPLDVLISLVYPSPFPVIGLAVATASAVGRIRYI